MLGSHALHAMERWWSLVSERFVHLNLTRATVKAWPQSKKRRANAYRIREGLVGGWAPSCKRLRFSILRYTNQPHQPNISKILHAALQHRLASIALGCLRHLIFKDYPFYAKNIPLPKRVHPRILEGKEAYIDSVSTPNNPSHSVAVVWSNYLSDFCDFLSPTNFL